MPIQPYQHTSSRLKPYPAPPGPSNARRSASSSSLASRDAYAGAGAETRHWSQTSRPAVQTPTQPRASRHIALSPPALRHDAANIFDDVKRYYRPGRASMAMQLQCAHQSPGELAAYARDMLRQGQAIGAERLTWHAVELAGPQADPRIVEVLLSCTQDVTRLKALVNELQVLGVPLVACHFGVVIDALAAKFAATSTLCLLRAMNRAQLEMDDVRTGKLLGLVLRHVRPSHIPVYMDELQRMGALTGKNVNQALMPVGYRTTPLDALQMFLEEMLHHDVALQGDTVTAQVLASVRAHDDTRTDFWLSQAGLFGSIMSAALLDETTQRLVQLQEPNVAWKLHSAAAKPPVETSDAAFRNIFGAALEHGNVSLAIKMLLWCSQNNRSHLLPECNAQFASTFNPDQKSTGSVAADLTPLPVYSDNKIESVINHCVNFLDAEDGDEVDALL